MSNKSSRLRELSDFLRLLMVLDPPRRAKLLAWCGICLIGLMLIFPFFWEKKPPPVKAPWFRIDGNINSYGDTWEHDRRLANFGVRFRSQEGAVIRTRLFSEKGQYAAAGLKLHSPVLLDVEEIEGKTIVRQLITLQGETLYHLRLSEHVVVMNNRGVIRGVIFFGVLASGFFIAAGCAYFHKGMRRQAGR